MKLRCLSLLALVPVALLVATNAHANIDNGLVASTCIPVEASFFQPEITEIGSSCTTFGRVAAAHKDAVEELATEAALQCDDVYEYNPGFYAAYCGALCDYEGWDHSRVGVFVCETDITDEDTWSGPATCFTGYRQYSRLTADIGCGCRCYDDPVAIP